MYYNSLFRCQEYNFILQLCGYFVCHVTKINSVWGCVWVCVNIQVHIMLTLWNRNIINQNSLHVDYVQHKWYLCTNEQNRKKYI